MQYKKVALNNDAYTRAGNEGPENNDPDFITKPVKRGETKDTQD